MLQEKWFDLLLINNKHVSFAKGMDYFQLTKFFQPY
jgi:hypothetical protein